MFPNTIDISAPQGHLQEENSVNGRSPEFGEGSSLETSEPRARDCEVRTWVYTTVQQVYTTLFCSVHIGSQVVGRTSALHRPLGRYDLRGEIRIQKIIEVKHSPRAAAACGCTGLTWLGLTWLG